MALQFNPFTGTFDVAIKGDTGATGATGATGTVSAAGDGTASTPGISFTSDPNSGVYRISEDVLGVATGGTEKLTIDASGNVTIDTNTLYVDATNNRVGIGTTSPSVALDITSGDFKVKRSANNDGAIYFGSTFSNYIYSGNTSNIMAFAVNGSEAIRLDPSGRLLVGTNTNTGGAHLQVNGNRIRIATDKTPASATDTGSAGEICWDTNYIYVCTATNTWKRTAIATW